jgi:hypothetical protein
VSALQAPSLSLPPGVLPLIACRSAIQRYREGGPAERLVAVIDRYGEELEDELYRRLREQADEF